MKLVKSQLELKDFFIVNSKYTFVNPEEENSFEGIEIKDIFNNYEIEIDFIPKLQGGQYFVYVKININDSEKPLPGYSLFVEGVAIFNFNEAENIDDALKNDYVWTSGVSIAINNLRNFITNETCYFPFGRYTFPSVDLTALIKLKKARLEEKKKARKDNKSE